MPFPEKEFVLNYVLSEVSKMEDGKNYYGGQEEHFHIPWRICISRIGSHISFMLECLTSSETLKWTIKTESEFKVLSPLGKNLMIKNENTYESKVGESSISRGSPTFMEWTKINDYMVDEKLVFEVHSKIKNTTGIAKKKLKNFDKTSEEFSDVVLTVNNERFYLSKLFLAVQSNYFKALFCAINSKSGFRKFLASQSTYFNALLCGNFKESGDYEIKLADISEGGFQNFLEVLHGELAIDEDTVEGVLHLADMFDAQAAVRRCEEFLLEKSEKTLKKKLQMAAGYQLKSLKINCLSKIKTLSDIRSVLPGDLNDMDHSVMATLFQKSLSFQS